MLAAVARTQTSIVTMADEAVEERELRLNGATSWPRGARRSAKSMRSRYSAPGLLCPGNLRRHECVESRVTLKEVIVLDAGKLPGGWSFLFE